MKKIILIISLIILSVALLYGSFKVFYRFNRLEISNYYWSKYYKDGSRDYFLSKEEQTFCWEVDFKNPKKEAIYFGLFDYLISEKDTIEISKNKSEVLIKINTIKDDNYIYDEKNYSLVGFRKKNIFQIGQKIKIKIIKADLERRQLDFILA